MSTRDPLLDPTGDSERDTNTTLAQPRPQSLRGLTVGLLDNTKPNGLTILEAVGRELTAHYGELAASGKEAIAKGTGWRLPADHPDAPPQTE
jgi:hypothetical protein